MENVPDGTEDGSSVGSGVWTQEVVHIPHCVTRSKLLALPEPLFLYL